LPGHLYGVPADLDPILEIAQQHGLKVIEDCAEAHGATYRGKKVGSFGDAAAFSFFGNKIMTSGEGGMVVSNDAQMIQRIGFLKSHGQDPHRPYWHPEVAYNYRLTALQAAFGLAQLEGIDENIARKQKIAKRYEKEFTGIRGVRFQQVPAKGKSVCWIFHFRVTRAAKATRDQLMAALSRARIDSRPVFYPMTELPPYASKEPYPVSHAISSEGIGLPTGANLSNEQQDRVIQTVLDALQ
jgi:perosamine synthetase